MTELKKCCEKCKDFCLGWATCECHAECCKECRKISQHSWGRVNICQKKDCPCHTTPCCERCVYHSHPVKDGNRFCSNSKCECHTTPTVNYEHISHTHCWSQKQPSACGIPLDKHTQCCLCDLKPPTECACQGKFPNLENHTKNNCWTTVSPTVEPTETGAQIHVILNQTLHRKLSIPEYEEVVELIGKALSTATQQAKEEVVRELEEEVERLRRVRILIPDSEGGKSKCITEGYHRCLVKVARFIKNLKGVE